MNRILAAALIASALPGMAAAQTAPGARTGTGTTTGTQTGGAAAATGANRTGIAPPEPIPNAARPGSGIPADRAYRINPGDEIEVYVWGDERLQRTLRVLPDGSFAFPLAGSLRAEGRTVSEIETEISQRLASQYRGSPPQVTVSVQAPSGLQISVIGKVRGPGSFSPGRYISVLEALALAGGPADFAAVNDVVILRTRNGTTQVIPAGLSNVLRGRPSGRDLTAGGIPMLQPGDTVVVP